MTQDNSKIDALFQKRYHGAGNHRGALYHSLYACHLGLNLDGSVKSRLGTERYEDLEVETSDGSLALYQLKCEATKLDYGKLEAIFASFADVIREKSVASCCIVTATGYPPEVENWLVDPKQRKIPAKLMDRISKAAKGDTRIVGIITNNLTLVTVQTAELCQQVSRTIATRVGMTQASHESFLHALSFQMDKWSGERATVSHAMIAKVLADVQSQFESGSTNPAVEQGFVTPVSFAASDPNAEDFYEGRAARPGHIAAKKDVPRKTPLRDIRRALDESNVAAIISSSGQGKSALALRHLSSYTTEDFVYEVKVCRTAEDAAAIAQFVRFRLQLGLGVSLFIDNLSRAQSAWIELAHSLAGESVKIILTSREEDWKLFAGDLSRVDWKRVSPTLGLEEARQIFANLRAAGKLHDSVQAADEAYSRVSEAKLLIEYVYLLTQGELLEERLVRQVRDLNGRDSGAVDCLRLVSMADQMNLRVEASDLVQAVDFQGDAQLAIQSLEGEYLVVQDGLCSGLHPVRSQHLVKILHPYGVEPTLAKLLRLVDDVALPEFTYSLLARTDARPERLLEALMGRIGSGVSFRSVWEKAYAGSEVRHAQGCLSLLETLEQGVGRAGVNLFPLFTPPFLGENGLLETMREIVDAERFEVLRATVDAVPVRNYTTRFETSIAEAYGGLPDAARGLADTLALAKAFWLAGWHDEVGALLDTLDWRNTLLALPLPLALRMAFLEQQARPKEYEVFVQERRAEIMAYLVRETRSLAIEEDEDKLIVSFIVDPYEGVKDNDQAVSRVQAAKGLLPGYARYATKQIRPLELPIPLPYDDAHKDGPNESWHSEEITDLNRQWTAAVEVVTSSDSIVGWEWSQRSAIIIAAHILEDFARFVERQDRGRAIGKGETEACAARLDAFEKSNQARRSMPSDLSDEQKANLKEVEEVFNAAHALVGNVFDELLGKDEGETNRKQVILYGLRDVHTFALPAQVKLNAIRQRAGLDDGTDFAKGIRSTCESLYRSIERRGQIERGQARLDSLSKSTADFLHHKLKEESEELARRVRLHDKVLLHTPGKGAERFDMPSWLFTLEVEALEDFIADALTVCIVFSVVFDSFWGNFIAVPVRRGARVSSRAYRALAPVLREAVSGHEPDSMLIWPTDEVDNLPNVLFGLQAHQARPELDLVQPFIEAGEKLAYAKAASVVEAAVLGASLSFTDRIASERLIEKFEVATEAVRAYVPSEALAEFWSDVLEAVEQNVAVLDQSPDQFIVKNGLLSAPLDRYMAAALAKEDHD